MLKRFERDHLYQRNRTGHRSWQQCAKGEFVRPLFKGAAGQRTPPACFLFWRIGAAAIAISLSEVRRNQPEKRKTADQQHCAERCVLFPMRFGHHLLNHHG